MGGSLEEALNMRNFTLDPESQAKKQMPVCRTSEAAWSCWRSGYTVASSVLCIVIRLHWGLCDGWIRSKPGGREKSGCLYSSAIATVSEEAQFECLTTAWLSFIGATACGWGWGWWWWWWCLGPATTADSLPSLHN